MSDDAAAEMKARLRADLLAAMKLGGRREVALLRELVATLDNAEAAAPDAASASLVRHDFKKGSAEVERLRLSGEQGRDILLQEIEKREHAAAEYARLGRGETADDLRADASAARRYVED